ncbi:MAG: hypothetical protein IPI81_16540 [Flavobacteriales bacterium]|nr:hypothetical protein [Flavobacteriales bacterium]MCC6938307.1 hypothetical protein [Flavobacteriales bacterium]
MIRSFLSVVFLLHLAFSLAQATVIQKGKPFTKTLKGSSGDLFTVVDGIFAADGRHILYVEEGLTPKVVRLDALLQPTEELVLKDLVIDGLKWTAVTPIVENGSMRCLMVSAGKKGSDYGIGNVSTSGTLSITGFQKLVSFPEPYANDPSNTMVVRPLPDPILFTKGLAYVQQERLIRSPDGEHFLLNHYSNAGKGNKKFHAAWLDKDLTVLWSNTMELPYEDAKSSIHQIVVANDGTFRLLTYVFQCKGAEQLGDKNCHELHLTTIAGNGKEVSDVLLEKDFVSSARIVDRNGGRVAIALRYGALTGQPGLVVSFDPADAKLKPTPLVTQRLPSIHKAKLMAYGDPTADPRKPPSRTAKVADEIVDLLDAPDGGMTVVETFLETMFPLQMGEVIAMRHLSGPIRVSQVLPNDSLGWQRTVERALMTTAGQAYEGSVIITAGKGIILLHGHTPKGFDAILKAGVDAADMKNPVPAEPLVLKAVAVDRDGTIKQEGTALMMEEDFVPCPMGALMEPNGTRALVKAYDRGTQYRFFVIDLAKLGQ